MLTKEFVLSHKILILVGGARYEIEDVNLFLDENKSFVKEKQKLLE